MIEEQKEEYTIPLLSAKTHQPPLPEHYIHRQSLESMVSEALHESGRLIYLSAPPGYGKTTLLSLLKSGLDYPSAWLSLDPFDNDPDYFTAYLQRAILNSRFLPDGKRNETKQRFSNNSVGILSLFGLIEEVGSPFFLVLDNLQEIENREILSALRRCIEYLPQNCSLAVASSEDVILPLSQFRNSGRLIELRQEDLRASEEETLEFFSIEGIHLPDHFTPSIVKKLEGWWTCITLFGVTWHQKTADEREEFVKHFRGTERFIADFLLENVYDGLSEECAHSATLLAVPNFFNEELGEIITDSEQFPRILEQLQRLHLITVRKKGLVAKYRYHPLLRDYLRHRVPSERRREIHLSASQWYERKGFLQLADHHRRCAGIESAPKAAAEILNHCLSRRETDLLQALNEGLLNDEIGERLFISTGTVKWHLHNIYEKLGVRCRTEAVRKARELGII